MRHEHAHSGHGTHHSRLERAESRILEAITSHHSMSEVQKELTQLRMEDARTGRNFVKDLEEINIRLGNDLAAKHLPKITIEENAGQFVLRPHSASEVQSQHARLPHAVSRNFDRESRNHSGTGTGGKESSRGRFVPPGEIPEGEVHRASGRGVRPGDNSPSRTGFSERLLQRLGLPVTPENLKFLDAWQKAEGGSADNPFNTTQNAPGARVFNSVGVKRYPSIEAGVEATARTLNNGHYTEILRALKTGDNAHTAALALSRTPWGTGNGVARLV